MGKVEAYDGGMGFNVWLCGVVLVFSLLTRFSCDLFVFNHHLTISTWVFLVMNVNYFLIQIIYSFILCVLKIVPWMLPSWWTGPRTTPASTGSIFCRSWEATLTNSESRQVPKETTCRWSVIRHLLESYSTLRLPRMLIMWGDVLLD